MVVKVYISGISGNKEVKKRQQRVLLILDSKNVQYEVIDIAEPENEGLKDFMQTNCTSPGATISDPNPRHPLPPQIFNDDDYCGDYDQFDLANEVDEMEKFLKLEPSDSAPLTSNAELKLDNGEIHSEDVPKEANETKDAKEEESKDENVPDNNESKSDAVDVKVENGDENEKNNEQEDEEEEAEEE